MTPPTRLACIDVGSNTTRLLVADRTPSGLTEVAAVKAFTSLGAGLAPESALPADRIADVVAAVGRQLAQAASLGVPEVAVVATSAVRSAPNGQAVADAVLDAHGVRVRVLDGRQEAAYAFAGATLGLAGTSIAADALLGVVDVGGGSTELVLGTLAHGPTWSVSLPLGSARLPACADPPGPDDLQRLRGLVHTAFAGVRPPGRPVLALAVGGSATSVGRLVGAELSARSLTAALGVLCSGTVADVAAQHALEEQRVALLPAGLVLLGAAAATLGAPLQVARGGLREGVLLAGGFGPG